MRKILWFIVCLMTMVMFTSCSKDDEVENNSIVGNWRVVNGYNIIPDNLSFSNTNCIFGNYTCKYFVDGNNIRIYYKEKHRNATDAEIEYIKEQLNNARGDRIYYWREKLAEARKYTTYEFNLYGTIEKLTNRELVIKFFIDTAAQVLEVRCIYKKV